MTWLRRLLAHFGHARIPAHEYRRALRVARTIGEADPVIKEYRKLDGALVIRVERKPQ